MNSQHPGNVGRWFDAHAKALVLYARQWLEDEAARDAVQEAFIRLLRLGSEPHNPKAWLYRTVRHAALDVGRAERRRRDREQKVASQRAAWFDCRPGDAIDAAEAQKALARLPEEQREVIVLRLWSGLSLAEVAEICQAPISTVFSRYRAGLAAIRKELESCKQTGETTN